MSREGGRNRAREFGTLAGGIDTGTRIPRWSWWRTAGAGMPSSNPAAPARRQEARQLVPEWRRRAIRRAAPQAGVGAPTAVNPTGTITPAGTNPTGTGTSTTGNSALRGNADRHRDDASGRPLAHFACGQQSNPALNSGTAGVTNGVPNSAAMQSNSQSQFGPGMNPQFGAVPGTLGSPSSTYGVAPNSSQMGTNNYGPYGQSTPNAAANSATTGSRNWGGPIVSWQPGYGSWSSGYAAHGSPATPSNGSTGYRGLPGSSTQDQRTAGHCSADLLQRSCNHIRHSGMENYEMNNQGPLAFRRGPSPYNTAHSTTALRLVATVTAIAKPEFCRVRLLEHFARATSREVGPAFFLALGSTPLSHRVSFADW